MQKENQIESKIRILLMVTGILLIGLCVSFQMCIRDRNECESGITYCRRLEETGTE